ncbi:MAG TPA: cytochrome b [Roseiarcus sp.]
MVVRSNPRSYDGVQRTFHWVMAAVVLTALALGLVAHYLLGNNATHGQVVFIHKSLGMTALVLGVLRVAYRLAVGAPPYAKPLGWLTQKAAQAGHLALYVLMLALPIAGYIGSSAGGHEVPWFGVFDFPSLLPHNGALAHRAGGAHLVFAWTIIGVLALHFAAVVWHVCVKRDEVLSRMWPSRSGALGKRRDRAVSGAGGSVL